MDDLPESVFVHPVMQQIPTQRPDNEKRNSCGQEDSDLDRPDIPNQRPLCEQNGIKKKPQHT